MLEPHQPAGIELARIVFEQTDVDFDAGCAQALGAVRCRRIRVGHRGDHPRHTGSEQGVGAWRRPPWWLHGSNVT